MINLLLALALTQIIELLVVYLFWFKSKIELLTLFFINLLTNPLANLLFWNYYDKLNKLLLMIIIEIFIIIIEAFLIKAVLRKEWARSFLISVVINLSSFFLGLILLLFL